MSTGLPLAFAQAPAPAAQSDQDHGTHHPDAGQGAPSGSAATPTPAPAPGQTPNRPSGTPMMGGMGQGGMMGQGSMMGQGGGMGDMGQMTGDMSRMMSNMGRMMGDMGQMMPMTGAMMAQGGGMGMPFEHVEGRLAFLKAELKITSAQESAWNKFADAYRAVAKEARENLRNMATRTAAQAPTAPERLARYERLLTLRLDAVRTMKAAFDPLYAALGDEQKKAADQLLGGPMGLM